MGRAAKLLPIFFLMFLLLSAYSALVNVTITAISPANTPLANSTLKLICPNYTNNTTTNSTGVAVVAVPNATNCLVITKYNNSYIVAMITNTAVNATYTINASTYNTTNVSLMCPKELQINSTFYYDNYSNLTYTFPVPYTMYVENVSNFTLKFPEKIKKGIYIYELHDIKVNNESVNFTNGSIDLAPYTNNNVEVNYIKTVTPALAFLIIALIIIILILALKAGGKGLTHQIFKENYEFIRKR